MLIVSESLFERRDGKTITNAAREIAQVQALTCGIDWPEKALQAPLQILRADQEGLGVLIAWLD